MVMIAHCCEVDMGIPRDKNEPLGWPRGSGDGSRYCLPCFQGLPHPG